MSSQDRILTVPNGLTLLRAFGIPLFLWVYLVDHRPVLSFVILAIGALTDYLDGKVARALNQESKLGAIMDPAIDRAYIAATIVSLALRHVIPWWLVIVLIARDVWLALVLIVVRRRGGKVFSVTFLGKAATFNLLYAFPLLLVNSPHGLGRVALVLGWSFAIWGMALYLLTGIHYSYLGLTPSSSHYRQSR
ncbi:MAG: CDP-alcohol phosphatidyltransferase family protein [Actinomycetes bacterium]